MNFNALKRKAIIVGGTIALTLALAACNPATVTPTFEAPTAVTRFNNSATPTKAASNNGNGNSNGNGNGNGNGSNQSQDGPGCKLASNQPPNDDNTPRSKVLRTYKTSDGRTASLPYGQGQGGQGDFGWAHIRNKHIYGIWHQGGIITTYPEAGICSEASVLNLLGTALQKASPQHEGNKSTYRYDLPGGKYDVLIVLGSDGTIITGYPEQK